MATTHIIPVDDKLQALLTRFESWLFIHARIGDSTVAAHLGTIRRAHEFLGEDPSIERIHEYMISLRRAGTAAPYLTAMCTVLERYSAFLGRPLELIRPPKSKAAAPTPLSEAEIAVLLHCAKNLREKAMLAVLAYTGIRNNEFCHLRVRDIDIANGLLRVEIGKNSKQRLVGLAGAAIAILVEYCKGREANPDALLFTTVRHGYELEPQDVRKLVRTVAKRAGFSRRIWPHLLRHSLATAMIERGAHLLTVRDQLGHVYVDTTMTYVHRSQKALSNDYRQFAPCYL